MTTPFPALTFSAEDCLVCGVKVLAARNGVVYHVVDDLLARRPDRPLLSRNRSAPYPHLAEAP